MKKFMLTLLVVVVSLTACKKDKDPEISYAGTYKGSYTGGDKGSLIVDVDANGNLNGTSVSSNTLEAFGITGKVDANGKFSGSTEIGTVFTGTFTAASVNGTWSNPDIKLSGTWTGTKQ